MEDTEILEVLYASPLNQSNSHHSSQSVSAIGIIGSYPK